MERLGLQITDTVYWHVRVAAVFGIGVLVVGVLVARVRHEYPGVLAIWGALNMIFVGGDLFTLYVALELLTFSAVPLVSLDGRSEALQAALRYLLFALQEDDASVP